MADGQFKRHPAVEKHISDISPDNDIRIRIFGTIIGTSEGSVVIDDGTGKTEIIFDDPNLIAGLSEGKLVRVVARILPLINGYECRGEAVQELDGFDISLYKKAKEVLER